ncbi:HTH-type transcriptional activator RhaS [Paenibacillus allorhizosphaerae]|uniref:HTH-type transcriptional activator RhaS n=1 Tax=Paenibacillus allorhizosphaerae TaxID=2849866 RepID=A0ABM8VRX8_9BACL|nr:helix-turn-helix domain-containing protein [Paenibacillus allorhizosphaerae]CAG7655903.1 HTH-type transcriptional activator RhaS [Paenibacillus allorhizosphaerae]
MNWHRMKRQSLFMKIFLSFLSIILLFVSFHMISFRFFTSGIQTEIIQYNRLILKNSAERYQTHFSRLKTLLFGIYNDEKLVAFNRQMVMRPDHDVNFWQAGDILKMLRSHAYNPVYYLDNLLIYFDKPSFVIEKEGTSESAMFFTNFYKNAHYSDAYWEAQFERGIGYKMHSAEKFAIKTLNSETDRQLIPISFRVPPGNYQMIALLDASSMMQAFYGGNEENNQRFMILNEDGSVLYRSSDEITVGELPAFESGQDYKLAGDFYYFIDKDNESKLTYVTAVPYADIASQVSKLNYTMYAILAVSILIGVAASLFFSRGIHRPFKQVVASILHRKPEMVPSKIQEFDLIHKELYGLIKEKEEIHNDLLNKKSLLTSYGYITKLKSINSDINEWKDIMVKEEPYVIVMYQLHFRMLAGSEQPMDPDRAAYYIREYIQVLMTENFPSSHTFQMENNQILSFVTVGEDNAGSLHEALHLLKRILDRDKELLLVAIAVSPVYRHSSQFNEAYRQVLDMVQQAKPGDETQIITEHAPATAHFAFTPLQEQELYAGLQAGNVAACGLLIDRMLDQMAKKEASLLQYRRFAEGIAERSYQMVETSGAGAVETQQREFEMLKQCYTREEFKQFYDLLFAACAELIRSQKTEKDHTIEFVMKCVETRYAEDISLDMLADKLNLSAAYLSVYIKEKTGMNFSDHINTIRIRKAKQLLSQTNLIIHDISLQIGYRNVTSFNRMFKKLTGMSPGEFRKNQAAHSMMDELSG